VKQSLDLISIKEQVITLAKEVGVFIRTERKTFDRAKTEYKGISNMVSYVDKEAERRIVEKLTQIVPHAGVIAEEGTGKQKVGGLNWIVDPLDGTTNFIHGLPIFCISIALVQDEDPLVGVVFEVNLQECFHATKGGGAWLEDERISVSPINKLADSLIATGFPYAHLDRMPEYMKLLTEFIYKSHGFRRIGSAAVDLAYVACGRFESFYEHNLSSWDVAAGSLLVTEAGGQVSNFKNEKDYIFSGQILASGKIHDEMLEILGTYFGK
jgi:myo-inositol-1(or 4)-monophosphatase